MKRPFDLTLALVALLILSPLLLVVYLLIRLKMPDGSPIFQQKRVGRYGKLLSFYIIPNKYQLEPLVLH